MNSGPLIVVHKCKKVSSKQVIDKINQFLSINSDTTGNIIGNDISRPPDDVLEKLKIMIVAMNEEELFVKSEKSKNKRAIVISRDELEEEAVETKKNKKSKKKHKVKHDDES